MNKNETASAKAESAAKTAERDKQTIRLLQWIRRNPVWWMLICTPDDKQMTLEKMKMIIQRLAKDQLYNSSLFCLRFIGIRIICTTCGEPCLWRWRWRVGRGR